MVVVSTHLELVALELGMQSVARHGLQVQLDDAQSKLVDAVQRIDALEKALGITAGQPIPTKD